MTTIVWAVGLLAAVGALLYMAAYRRRFWWVESGVLNVPRTLTPLYLALMVFSIGLALLSFQNEEPLALWVAAIWSSLALLFAQQLWASVLAGFQAGWDTQMGPAGEDEQPSAGVPIWWIVAIVLLVLNTGLVAWSANAQWQAGTLRVDLRSLLALPQSAGTPTLATGARATPTGALSSLGIMTPTVQPTTSETPVVMTPAPVVIALPSPTPSPTPAPVIPTVTITVEAGANARALPTLEGEVFGILLQGEQAAALGRSEDGTWIQIQMNDGRTAWVAASVVTLNVDANTLPLVPVN